MIINAKSELEKILKDVGYTYGDIKCFNVSYYNPLRKKSGKIGVKGSDIEKLKKVLAKIDYDNSYGIQYLYGLILFKDGNWLERAEYDGSEWWEFRKVLNCEDVLNYRI